MMIFQHKYAPQTFGDLIFPDLKTKQRLWDFGNNQRHNSLIFHGPFGTAKTTTARVLEKMRTAGTEYGDVSFYRASDVTHDTFTRLSNEQRLQKFAGVTMPVTIIDEIDAVDHKLQYKLRWELDMYADRGCFVFTTNKLYNVDPGLIDRCDVVEIPAANTDHWFQRANWILQQEDIHLSYEDLTALLHTCDGSIRDLMRALEDVVLHHKQHMPPERPTPKLHVVSN